MEFKLGTGNWLNKPEFCSIGPDSVIIKTTAKTDLWQRSYYGFRNDNAPVLQFQSDAKNVTHAIFVDNFFSIPPLKLFN
ncbi:MAG: hypothetical protein methR_P0292 [Methyloprofundus sp.]|nr:MAG: hypothetical protein methR_P0292 [Methyloprofundus sp.]